MARILGLDDSQENVDNLVRISALYATIYTDLIVKDIPDHKIYFNHGFLPLGILDGFVSNSYSVLNQECICCKRFFPRTIFPKSSRSLKRCDVCRGIDIQKSTEYMFAKHEHEEISDECYNGDEDFEDFGGFEGGGDY